MKTRNSEVLEDFISYCRAHPDERFWQALRNWCGWPYVIVSTDKDHLRNLGLWEDTFYWEGRSQVTGHK